MVIQQLTSRTKSQKLIRNIMQWWRTMEASGGHQKIGVVSTMSRKGEKMLVENYRPMLRLNKEVKVLQKYPYKNVFEHILNFMTQRHWAVFAKDQFWQTFCLSTKTDTLIRTGKTKPIVTAAHNSELGVNGCLLEVLYAYIEDAKHCSRAENANSKFQKLENAAP